MKLILNGVVCESDDNCSSSAGSFKFASAWDAMCAFSGAKKCEYCGKEYSYGVIETVNEKQACPECRTELVPPMAAYRDRFTRMWGGKGS